MKTTITLTAFALMILFTACGSDKQEQQDPARQEMKQAEEATTYYCPMKCEGEKTYAEMGSCPVCGMDLVETGTEGDASMDSHEGHDHEGHAH